jgi:hypothetical protein
MSPLLFTLDQLFLTYFNTVIVLLCSAGVVMFMYNEMSATNFIPFYVLFESHMLGFNIVEDICPPPPPPPPPYQQKNVDKNAPFIEEI